jgi:hypothetical protein
VVGFIEVLGITHQISVGGGKGMNVMDLDERACVWKAGVLGRPEENRGGAGVVPSS